ncbi:hypothetical protein J6590_079596 [Homalodisca vitripennis]|nr:hypothetical protein J6590_079596 [Homalodisca vitripennis]
MKDRATSGPIAQQEHKLDMQAQQHIRSSSMHEESFLLIFLLDAVRSAHNLQTNGKFIQRIVQLVSLSHCGYLSGLFLGHV